MHIGDIAETNPENGIFSTFGLAVTLNFDLLTPKPNQFIFVPSKQKSGEYPSVHTKEIVEKNTEIVFYHT